MILPPTPNADNTIVEDSEKSIGNPSDQEDEAMEMEIQSLLKEISQQPDNDTDEEGFEETQGISDVLMLVEKSEFEKNEIHKDEPVEEAQYKSIQPNTNRDSKRGETARTMTAPKKSGESGENVQTPAKKSARVIELPKEDTDVKEAKKEIETEFQDLHNASMFIESDSMLVSKTEFIDMNVEPEFKLSAPVLDSILEVSFKFLFLSNNSIGEVS